MSLRDIRIAASHEGKKDNSGMPFYDLHVCTNVAQRAYRVFASRGVTGSQRKRGEFESRGKCDTMENGKVD